MPGYEELIALFSEEPELLIGPVIVSGGTGYLLGRMGVPLILNIPLTIALGAGVTAGEVIRNKILDGQDIVPFYTKTAPYWIKEYYRMTREQMKRQN